MGQSDGQEAAARAVSASRPTAAEGAQTCARRFLLLLLSLKLVADFACCCCRRDVFT